MRNALPVAEQIDPVAGLHGAEPRIHEVARIGGRAVGCRRAADLDDRPPLGVEPEALVRTGWRRSGTVALVTLSQL